MNTFLPGQRGISRNGLLIVVAVVAIGIVTYSASRRGADVMTESTPIPTAMMEKSPDAMMEKSPDAMKASPDAMMEKAAVNEYTRAAYDEAVREGRVVALYFYANWCPICKAEFPKFQAAVGQQSSGKIAAFRVSFNDSDTSSEETAAAKSFQVGSQHTLVIVKDGAVVSKELVSGETQASFEAKLSAAL